MSGLRFFDNTHRRGELLPKGCADATAGLEVLPAEVSAAVAAVAAVAAAVAVVAAAAAVSVIGSELSVRALHSRHWASRVALKTRTTATKCGSGMEPVAPTPVWLVGQTIMTNLQAMTVALIFAEPYS